MKIRKKREYPNGTGKMGYVTIPYYNMRMRKNEVAMKVYFFAMIGFFVIAVVLAFKLWA